MTERADRRARLAECYVSACREEVEALKPGNVHVFADGHGMVVQQFLDSSRVSSDPLTRPGWQVGRRLLEAIRATRRAVGLNTNLGIVLLCGPLLAAAERCVSFERTPTPYPSLLRGGVRGGGTIPSDLPSLRASLASILGRLDMADARDAFAAIAHADPGGLGTAQHDVRQPPRIGLLEAMRQAADRDMIARQYAEGFADVFDVGVAELDAARGRGETGMWPCVAAYLRFVATFPDSHVARKSGMGTAAKLAERAAALRVELVGAKRESGRLELLYSFDRELKAANVNPGTSADLTVASLLVRNLRDNLHIRVDDA